MDRRLVTIIARQELRNAIRNRWFPLYTIVFAGLIVGFSLVAYGASNLTGQVGFGRTAAGLLNLLMLMVPLIGLTVGAQVIAASRQDRSLDYLMALPVSPRQVYLGKFIGAAVAMLLLLVIGFGAAALVLALRGWSVGISSYLVLVAMTLVLGLAMVSVGMAISSFSRQTSAALGVALTLWLALVIVGDLGIMGSSIVLGLSPQAMLGLTLLNPLDVYKLLGVDLLQATLDVLGPAGVYAVDRFGSRFAYILLGLLAVWIVAPLPIGYWLFKRTTLA